MSTVNVIYRRKPVMSTLLSLSFMWWGQYELYRIYQGTHPTMSEYLEKAGIYSVPKAEIKETAEDGTEDKMIGHRGQAPAQEDARRRGIRIPLPILSLETLIWPFRKD